MAQDVLNWVPVVLHVVVAPLSAGHALLHKRDPKSAFGWIAVCLLFPLAGPFLYFLFGVNRVKTRARKLGPIRPYRFGVGYERQERDEPRQCAPICPPESMALGCISETVTRLPLVAGNQVTALHNGEEAYPRMLDAIEKARHSLYMATYIFETNATGLRFIDALARAQARGVDVRILVDGVGEHYSFRRVGTLLRKRGVKFSRFLPPRLFPPTFNINLRNHRKVLVADRCIGFTGGMNIGDRHLAQNTDNPSRVLDLHFRLEGPVVEQLVGAFLEDWLFASGEEMTPPGEINCAAREDGVSCRTITDGPNEDLDKLAMILLGAVSSARSRVLIMTPYFLPSREMIGALQAAALRGVEVVVILPARNNLPFVQWATQNMLWELLRWGVRVYYRPAPFAHSKLFVVDDHYGLIGSANIDPRSLRLNFELAVEIHGRAFAQEMAAHMEAVRDVSREVTLDDMERRPLAIQVRDALAWLFSPYL
ncbi:MAG: cardiolipin synthase [bacterium]|nr:cardiolipin synthase [bacterium]